MKKFSFIFVILIIFFGLFIYFNISIRNNIVTNEKVIKIINDTFQNFEKSIYEDNKLSSMEINKTDYIGLLGIPSISKIIPIESSCSTNYLDIKSMCYYNNKKLVIIGTNLNDSLPSYKSLSVNDKIEFTSFLGNIFEFNIDDIKNVKNIDNIDSIDAKFILVIRDYYELSYTLLIGN